MRVERPYDILQRELKSLAPLKAAIFSGLCAERLATCIWSFSKQEGIDTTIFLRLMEESWKVLLGEKNTAKLSTLNKHLREIIPHDDDYSYSLAGQAQNGLLCASHCANIILTSNSGEARGSSDNCISAAELLIFVVQRALGKTTMLDRTIEEDALVVLEIQKQLNDLRELENLQQPSEKKLAEIRSLNYQHAIPPAVMIANERL